MAEGVLNPMTGVHIRRGDTQIQGCVKMDEEAGVMLYTKDG